MPIYEHLHSVAGGINLDDSLINPPPGQKDSLFLIGDYRYALNCRIGSSADGNEGSCQNIRGTKKITTIYSWDGAAFVSGGSMPIGNNKCVGFYQNKADQNGIFLNYNSNGEPGAIYVFDPVPTTTTDANGDYSFTDLAPGAYTVSEVAQAGWGQAYPPSGDHDVILTSGGNATGDFGNFEYCIISGVKLLTPAARILPSCSSLSIAPKVSSAGVSLSGQWHW